MIRLVIPLFLLLAGCDRESREPIEPVPVSSEEAADRLVNGAEQAAADAKARMEQDAGPARSAANTNTQGEGR